MNTVFRFLRTAIPVTAIVLIVVQVIISNELATLGKRMGTLDVAVTKQQDLHETLETQVASASSLLTLRQRAQAEGFHDPLANQIVSLPAEVPVAFGVTNTQPPQTILP